ncbi:MAG TPA: TolC family protein [Gemmata sp.]|jgi:cobalt-zinc-cadmium efflux system outer membrane protein|nr:TolC family protein [Gemmata sp.]
MPENLPTLVNGTRKTRRFCRGGILLIPGFVLSTGCLYHGKEATDETVKSLASRPYDMLPEQLRDKAGSSTSKEPTARDNSRQTVNPTVPTDVQTVAYMEAAQDGKQPPATKYELHVPEAIPGSEAPLIKLPVDPAAKVEALRKLYPPLAPLVEEVRPLPGPNGKPYTLSDFQRIAAENSPTLRQAASDVQAARGNLIQTATYANPNVSVQLQPSNNSATSGAIGYSIDQVIQTGGKMRLQTAAAKKAMDNAELALRRARSDLATQVRNAYYSLLVAKETMRVTRALSVLTDEVYRVQLALTEKGGQNAAYEPAALRAQAYTARLAYQQATATYIYAWKTMVSTISERQLPLSEVAGRLDVAVPLYDYDRVLAHVLRNHTDALTALNGIDINKFNLKLNQVTPYSPNLDFNVGMFKDQALLPFGTYWSFGVTAPLPFWDQNRGGILTAESALARALEEPHRVEMALTNTLATNFTNYKTNLDAVEYYRRYVLPDQVRFYRGVLVRRQIDANAQFGDLVAAQQALASSVTTYLGLLGTLWSSVVSVADMLQTDDLFQNAELRGLPALPDLESLPPLPCCHPFGQTGAGCATPAPSNPPTSGPTNPMLPPSKPPTPGPTNPMLPPPSPVSPTGTVPATPTASPPPNDPQQPGARFIPGLSPSGR